ncbi:MAG: hypothetical protein EOM25_03235 [Deltaproteobacteria bacterium]|nr:hypothetical protein [Deltaproteobacteria bacterium]
MTPTNSAPSQNYLLIDYENIQKVDLSELPPNYLVKIFVGFSQKNIPFDLVQQAQELGNRLEWIKIDGQGNNALDFHIAFYMGKYLSEHEKAGFTILSKDKGFDPLIKHIGRLNRICRRINSLLELTEKTEDHPRNKNLERVIELLSKIDKNRRPRKRRTLTQQIASYFPKKLPEGELERIVDYLFIENLVSETDNRLQYEF